MNSKQIRPQISQILKKQIETGHLHNSSLLVSKSFNSNLRNLWIEISVEFVIACRFGQRGTSARLTCILSQMQVCAFSAVRI